MLNEEQQKLKTKKIIFTVRKFLDSDCESILQLSKEIDISSSSIQRYLNEEKIITQYLGDDVYDLVQEKLKINKEYGVIKGAHNSLLNNISTKDSHGKFTGCKSRNAK